MISALLMLVASTDATAANNATRNLWTECLAKSSAKYGKLTDQPVETLADVVITDCRFEEHATEPTLDGLRTPRSEEHTSELQSLMRISYALSCSTKNITKPDVI